MSDPKPARKPPHCRKGCFLRQGGLPLKSECWCSPNPLNERLRPQAMASSNGVNGELPTTATSSLALRLQAAKRTLAASIPSSAPATVAGSLLSLPTASAFSPSLGLSRSHSPSPTPIPATSTSLHHPSPHSPVSTTSPLPLPPLLTSSLDPDPIPIDPGLFTPTSSSTNSTPATSILPPTRFTTPHLGSEQDLGCVSKSQSDMDGLQSYGGRIGDNTGSEVGYIPVWYPPEEETGEEMGEIGMGDRNDCDGMDWVLGLGAGDGFSGPGVGNFDGGDASFSTQGINASFSNCDVDEPFSNHDVDAPFSTHGIITPFSPHNINASFAARGVDASLSPHDPTPPATLETPTPSTTTGCQISSTTPSLSTYNPASSFPTIPNNATSRSPTPRDFNAAFNKDAPSLLTMPPPPGPLVTNASNDGLSEGITPTPAVASNDGGGGDGDIIGRGTEEGVPDENELRDGRDTEVERMEVVRNFQKRGIKRKRGSEGTKRPQLNLGKVDEVEANALAKVSLITDTNHRYAKFINTCQQARKSLADAAVATECHFFFMGFRMGKVSGTENKDFFYATPYAREEQYSYLDIFKDQFKAMKELAEQQRQEEIRVSATTQRKRDKKRAAEIAAAGEKNRKLEKSVAEEKEKVRKLEETQGEGREAARAELLAMLQRNGVEIPSHLIPSQF